MIEGFRGIVLKGASFGATLRPAGVVAAIALGLALVALWRFRFTDEKVWEG